jgi:hypothetical protein
LCILHTAVLESVRSIPLRVGWRLHRAKSAT